MSDIGQGGRQGAVLGVEEGVLLAGQLSEWGYTVAAVDSSRAVAIVASTVDAAVAAQARGLPFLLEGGAPAAAVALEALGASGYAFLTPDDLWRGLMVLERRGWAPLGPAATVSDLLEEVCGCAGGSRVCAGRRCRPSRPMHRAPRPPTGTSRGSSGNGPRWRSTGMCSWPASTNWPPPTPPSPRASRRSRALGRGGSPPAEAATRSPRAMGPTQVTAMERE